MEWGAFHAIIFYWNFIQDFDKTNRFEMFSTTKQDEEQLRVFQHTTSGSTKGWQHEWKQLAQVITSCKLIILVEIRRRMDVNRDTRTVYIQDMTGMRLWGWPRQRQNEFTGIIWQEKRKENKSLKCFHFLYGFICSCMMKVKAESGYQSQWNKSGQDPISLPHHIPSNTLMHSFNLI